MSKQVTLCGLSLELPASVCDNISVLVTQKDAFETAAVDVLANIRQV